MGRTGKREGRMREEKVRIAIIGFFPTLSSLCLSLALPFAFPEFALHLPADPIYIIISTISLLITRII
jgi:hypothetical protein